MHEPLEIFKSQIITGRERERWGKEEEEGERDKDKERRQRQRHWKEVRNLKGGGTQGVVTLLFPTTSFDEPPWSFTAF
jgi:serine/threonine-protein kinase RIO1